MLSDHRLTHDIAKDSHWMQHMVGSWVLVLQVRHEALSISFLANNLKVWSV